MGIEKSSGRRNCNSGGRGYQHMLGSGSQDTQTVDWEISPTNQHQHHYTGLDA